MEIVRLESLDPRGWPAPVVTVGNFDGVHRGHQALVAATVTCARRQDGTAVVLTFDPHPARVLAPASAPSALMTLSQKAEVLGGIGVDRLAVLPFTPDLARETPEAFARLVLDRALGARAVVVGRAFRFGKDRAGDVSSLVAFGRDMGFEVEALAPVLEAGRPVSSSWIREALATGDVVSAARLLGRRFFLDGEVVRGAERGTTLGIPTANLSPINETIPALGVYACLGRLDRGPKAGIGAVVNVGRRPTFGGGDTVVEAHLLEPQENLYGHALRIEFAERLRGERAFAGADALVAQIRHDIAEARRVLEKA